MAFEIREHLTMSIPFPRTPEVIESRAALLERPDRDLVVAVLVRGQTATHLGPLMGVSPAVLRRRVKRLARRMNSRTFLDTMRCLPRLDPDDARLARRRFCQRAPLWLIAKEAGLNRYELRQRLERISAQIAVLSTRRRTSPAASKAAECNSAWTENRAYA
mgnify:CR=1 FL=1